MSYNDELSEMVRNFAKLHSERDSALQELALANSELKRLQAENEELKEQIKQLEDFIKSDGEIDHINHEYTYKLKQENEELKKRQITKNGFICDCEQNVKYRQALEEIRELMQENCNQCFEIDNFTKPDDCGICEWARVLKIISEVLDERN